jgi:ribose transport system permease protein
VPLAGLLLLLAINLATNQLKFDLWLNFFLGQSAVLVIVATGVVLVYSMGAIDISLGASVCVASMLGILTYNATGLNVAALLVVCIASGIAASAASAILATVFKLPVFLVTVAMLTILSSVALLLLGTNQWIDVPVITDRKAIYDLQNVNVYTAVIAFVFIVILVLQNYSKTGRHGKLLGGSRIVAKQLGISQVKQIFIAFLVSGIAVGIGAFITIVRAPRITSATGSSLGMDILMAVVFGGMPQAGGAKSKASAGLVGGFSITLFNMLLTSQGVALGQLQIIKGVIFLVIVFLTSMSFKGKLLYR